MRTKTTLLASVLAAYGTEAQRHAGYLRAQQGHDPWEGGEPVYEGTSSDAQLMGT